MNLKFIFSTLILLRAGLVFSDQSVNIDYNDLNSSEKSLKLIINEFTHDKDGEFNAFLEQKRREMLSSIEERFYDCDTDNDSTLDVYETTMCLPQVARQYRSADINKDNLISLDELSILAKEFYSEKTPPKTTKKSNNKDNQFAKE